jgi:AraC-like DNA-binding protein
MGWTFPSADRRADLAPAALRALASRALDRQIAALRAGADVITVLPGRAGAGEAHHHHCPELFLQLGGVSRFAVAGGEHRLAAGRILAIPPLTAHEEAIDRPPAEHWNLVLTVQQDWLSLHVGWPDPADPRRPVALCPDLIRSADAATGLAAFTALSRAADADARFGWGLAALVWVRQTIAGAAVAGGEEPVAHARAWLESYLQDPDLRVGDAAVALGRHPDHLNRLFRRATGRTLVGYLQEVRLQRARALLRGSALPIAGISRAVGLRDPRYFSRLYRRRFGCTPSAERRI